MANTGGAPRQTTDYEHSYTQHVQDLLSQNDREKAMALAIGGEFESFGKMILWLLIDEGLMPEHSVVDVGCGSGRLANALASYSRGQYLGTDVVPDLLNHAKALCRRPDWRFECVSDIVIPAPDGSAEMVCFFSIFTHLLHEDSYRYLVEANRVLRHGGKVVFSFLEFSVPSHWAVFQDMLRVRQECEEGHHNQFLGRDAIDAWSKKSGLSVTNIYSGDLPHIRLRQSLTLDDGRMLTEKASLGQSVCVLTKQ